MRSKLFKRFGVLGMILALMVFSVMSADAASWSQKFTRFSAKAGETLVLGDVVCIKPADSKAYKADANDSALRPAVGVIGLGGATNATVEIVVSGVLTGQTAASPGARLFLSETAGALTTSGPTNAQTMGWVLPGTSGTATSTKYWIQPGIPSSGGAAY
jgi:hypothetical protein